MEQLFGDRNDNLAALKNRDWDAVLDLATYIPLWVRTLGKTLAGHIGHYTFISTEGATNFQVLPMRIVTCRVIPELPVQEALIGGQVTDV